MNIGRTVLILEDQACSNDWITRLFAEFTQWRVVFTKDLLKGLSELDLSRSALVLVSGKKSVDTLKEIVGQVQRQSMTIPIVRLVSDLDVAGDSGEVSQALRAGIHDVVFATMLEQRSGFELLRMACLRQEIGTQEIEAMSQQLEQCQGNMELLDLLAIAMTSTIEREALSHLGLEVFAGICPNGRAAYCELFVAKNYVDNGQAEPSASAMELRCVGHYSPNYSAGCLNDDDAAPAIMASGQDDVGRQLIKLILADEIMLNVASPEKVCPALTGLWSDLDRGQVSLIPVRSSGQVLGMLMIFSPDQVGCTRLQSSAEALRVMARVFGSTLQNAQLYEEVDEAYQTLRQTQSQLVHSEKFAAMGVLSAEIAHEFNNPASFVISNLSVMREYVEMISGFVEGLETLSHGDASVRAEVKSLEDRFEIAFLREDLDNLIARSLSGMQRIHQIVQDLRYFSHDVAQEPGWVDLEQLVSAVLHLVNHESRFRAELELDFCGLPQVFSDANKLSQVLLNLFVNAAHSIPPGNPEENFIRVCTRRENDDVILSIQDSGIGIAEEDLPKIFEPFFTTKERGSATGLGLPIVVDILRGLGGDLKVSSKEGRGSLFEFRLPIRAAKFAVKKELRESGSYKTPPRPRRSTPVYRTLDAPPSSKASLNLGGANGKDSHE